MDPDGKTIQPSLALAIPIGLVWLINGVVCKVAGLVPRHEQIVAQILGASFASEITVLIGLAEVAMCFWVLSRWQTRVCGALQIALVLAMNVLEFSLARELLLWGPLNAVFALAFALFLGWAYFAPRRSG